MDLADDPTLDSDNILWCWDLGGAAILKPGVRKARITSVSFSKDLEVLTHRPADMVEHWCSLHSGSPVLRSTS
jgi:hypothetical protein